MRRLGDLLEWLGEWGWVVIFIALCLAALLVLVGDAKIFPGP